MIKENDLSIKMLFGIPVLVTKFSGHEQCKEKFLPWLEQDHIFENPDRWYCNVDTTIDNSRSDEELPWSDFITPAVDELNKYVEFFNPIGPIHYTVHAWLNRYKTNYSQEVHAHVEKEAVFSCAYMLKLPADSGKFTFVNQGFGNHWRYTHFASLCRSDFPVNDRYSPPLEEGDIVFFPSDLYHMVSPNNTDKLRATISANFGVHRA